jgi:aminoacylase
MTTEDRAVTLFRDFLRIRTDHPNPQYHEAVKFLQNVLDELGLPHKTFALDPNRPILLATWEGQEPSLPSVLLNSHTDVVPAVQEKWNTDPFAAEKDKDGNIFARGTQDMKCVCTQYLEAIRKMKAAGTKPKRTIHLLYVPDEEIGGKDGMMWFHLTPEFAALNVGVCIDEGLANPTDAFTVFYGERTPDWVKITATGNTGHGSRFIEGTATEKLLSTVNEMMEYRKEMFDKLHKGHHECGMRLGDVTSINLTWLKAGLDYQLNVVPTVAEAGFDIRIPPGQGEAVAEKLKQWTDKEGMTVTHTNKLIPNVVTPITPDSVWWTNIKDTLASLNMKVETEIFPASTDSRFVRSLNIPAFGFSPINNTPILLHDHNEFLNEKVYLRGIDIYVKLITNIANIPAPTN